jgi:pimeloyl-ACP methyl ester carboxylesterase
MVMMGDLVSQALNELLPCEVRRGELSLGDRALRWIEAGSGSPAVVLEAALGEPGSLAYAGVLPAVAEQVRVIAYDRAGIGASDPVSPVTLVSQVSDLATIAANAGDGPCVLAGHSWGGLLVLLAAAQHPDLIAGLVLIDPADEIYWSQLPAEIHRQSTDTGTMFMQRHAAGDLAPVVREAFTPFVNRLTNNQHRRRLLLDAYEACYAYEWQARMVHAESQIFNGSTSLIHQIRSAAPLPDVPVFVLSATKGAAREHRAKWTAVHADLAKSVTCGTHVVLEDTHHSINEDRPEAIASAITHVIADVRSGWQSDIWPGSPAAAGDRPCLSDAGLPRLRPGDLPPWARCRPGLRPACSNAANSSSSLRSSRRTVGCSNMPGCRRRLRSPAIAVVVAATSVCISARGAGSASPTGRRLTRHPLALTGQAHAANDQNRAFRPSA